MNVFAYRTTTAARAGAAAAFALLASAVLLAPSAVVAQQSVTVVVNGQTMNFDQPPIVRAGRVFVPLRGVFERLGASVVYSNGQINATGAGRTVSLTIGSTQATVDGQPATLDVAPFLAGERTMVPLRFIAQSLGAGVNWKERTSTVTINGGGGQPGPNPPPQAVVSLTYQWPTGTIYNHSPQIRFQVNREIAIGSFQVLLDGRNIGDNVQSNGQYFFMPAPFSLAMGNHKVRVRGRTAGGAPFDLNWTFYQASY
ncbi:MAG: copper amine oxidase N-terminal domain-containing protein [Candidatus Tumulicola sp.]